MGVVGFAGPVVTVAGDVEGEVAERGTVDETVGAPAELPPEVMSTLAAVATEATKMIPAAKTTNPLFDRRGGVSPSPATGGNDD